MRIPAHVIEDIDQSVERGACRLDQRRPNWYKDIDLKTLNMGDGCRCICGQLYGMYDESSVTKIVGGWVNKVLSWCRVGKRYGFDIPESSVNWAYRTNSPNGWNRSNAIWNRLERNWKNEIKARLAGEKEPK